MGIKGAPDTVVREICEEESNSTVCEVYAATGKISDIEINDCVAFCNAYGLQCVSAYEDKDSDCTRKTPVACDYGFTQPFYSTKDMICSCGNVHWLLLNVYGIILLTSNGNLFRIYLNHFTGLNESTASTKSLYVDSGTTATLEEIPAQPTTSDTTSRYNTSTSDSRNNTEPSKVDWIEEAFQEASKG